MPTCSVSGCYNHTRKTKGTNIKYYSFPKNQELRKIWIKATKRKDSFNVLNATICSTHFTQDSFIVPLRQQLFSYTPKYFRNLKDDAIPTLHLCNLHKTKTPSKSNTKKTSKSKVNKPLVKIENEIEFENVRPHIFENVPIKQEMNDFTEEEGKFKIDQFNINLANVETVTMPDNISEHNSIILEMNNKMKRLENEKNELKSICEQLRIDKEVLIEENKSLKATISSNMHLLICTPGQTKLLKVNNSNETDPLICR